MMKVLPFLFIRETFLFIRCLLHRSFLLIIFTELIRYFQNLFLRRKKRVDNFRIKLPPPLFADNTERFIVG